MTESYARYDYAWKTPGWSVQNPTVTMGSSDGYYDPGLPADITKVHITGTFPDFETGRLLEGVISVRCVNILRYTPTGQQVMPGVKRQRFRGHEGVNLVLPATDDPQLTGHHGYEARLTVKGVTQEFSFMLPSADTEVSIHDLITDDSVTPIEPPAPSSGMDLGATPGTLNVHLTQDADFSTSIEVDEAWEAGDTVRLVFASGQVWNATLAGTLASWSIDKAVANAIPGGTPVRLVVLTEGNEDDVWATGTVIRHA